MTHSVARFGMNLLLCSVAIPAIAAQSEQPPPPPATHAPLTVVHPGSSNAVQSVGPSQNTFRFVAGNEANEFAQRMKERLTDPEQRVALRAEQRAGVVSQNTGVARLVGLDPAMEQKLIELLTDQQMTQFERMYAQPRPGVPDLQKYADEITQQMNALRDLLGDEKLDRFQDFQMSQSSRNWVSQLSARLAPADRLQPDQEDRLTALKQEQFQMSSAAATSWLRRHPKSFEDMQRDAQRQTRIANEDSWRKRQVAHRALEQKAASFLTPTQLAELSRYQAQEQDTLRRYVEAARADEGLDPKIPEQPEVVEETPKLIEAQLRVDVTLVVNREPTTVTRTVRSGESFTFEAAQGLIVEATPRMYEDDEIDVHLSYYEEGATGRRRLSGNSISRVQARLPDGSMTTGGGGGTVISGRKGYAVESTINAKAL